MTSISDFNMLYCNLAKWEQKQNEKSKQSPQKLIKVRSSIELGEKKPPMEDNPEEIPPDSLTFDSKFESGNLSMATKVTYNKERYFNLMTWG